MIFRREMIHNTAIDIARKRNITEIVDILSKEMTKEKLRKDESKEPKKTEKLIETKKQIYICAACHNPVETDHCIYYSSYPYHIECVKCWKCNKALNCEDQRDDFIVTTPGLFLCMQHYNDQLTTNSTDQEFMNEYTQKKKEIFVDEVFNHSFLKDEDTSNYPPEDVLVTQDMLNDSIEKKPYEDFIPTISLPVDKPPQEIDFDQLPKVLGDDVAIIDIEKKISTIIKIALLSCDDLEPEEIVQEHQKYVDELKNRLNSSIENRAVIGNLVDEPEIKIPEDKKINEAFNKPSINQFQNTVELSKMEVKEIRKKIIEKLKKEKGKENWKFIFSHEDLYNDLEAQMRKDLENNPYEMIITGQTIIASKFFDEYGKIKSQIPPEKIIECFFYHGSKLNNHPKIAKQHFLMPGQDKEIKQLDGGYYGQGIYATENIFYASMYANGYNVLKINEKTYVICCRAIYNKDEVKDLTDLSYLGKKIDDKIKDNFGVNHAFVGSGNDFLPINEKDADKHEISANEYVFPNKYQFIPCSSFTIMRKDHYILWKDESINNNENSKYLEDLSKTMEINIYSRNNVDEAVDIIRKKKYAAVKLITNAGANLSGRDLILRAREIVGSNFVCLVFASSEDHMKWITQMENVLFTNDYEDFKKFAEIKMNINDLRDFIKGIKAKYEKNGLRFKINEKELLHFPKCDKNAYYKNYYQNNSGGFLSAIKKLFSFF